MRWETEVAAATCTGGQNPSQRHADRVIQPFRRRQKQAVRLKFTGGEVGLHPTDYRNAIVLTPEMSKRFRQRTFLQTAWLSTSTM